MKKLILFALLHLTIFSYAQEFGGNPPSMHWLQIKTDTARIIFPVGLDSTAQRVSNIIHWLAKNNPAPLGHALHPVNIVLQTQTMIANAYVSLAPFRSEFYLAPSLNNFDEGSIAWPDGLAVHEFRHVQQFNNFRNGLSRVAYYLFGEEGLLVAQNAAVPDWFFEGDAVYNETITTNQGRGRIPFFLNQYKSLWLDHKEYSWMKLRNGSFKDFIPDHYHLGYLLVNYGREKYGLDFWTKVTHDASAFRGLFYPFQQAIKRYAGVDYKTFRNNAIAHYQHLSDVQKTDSTQNAAISNITVPNKTVLTNYLFPYQINNDSLIYLKTSVRHRDAFFIKTNNEEKRVKIKDISIDQQYSYRNGQIVYAAYEVDPRWSWRDYSVIKFIDVHTGKERTLAHHTRYSTPDISPGGNKIAAVKSLIGGQTELVILNAENGTVLRQFNPSEINALTDPRFIDDNTLVTAVRLNDGRMALALATISSGALERLTSPSYGVIGYLSVSNGTVFFTGSFSGNDELYALDLHSRKVSRLTHTQLGNYYVNATAQKLVWSGFTADGYQLKEMDPAKGQWQEVSDIELKEPHTEFPVAYSDQLHDILLHDVPHRQFAVKDYKQGGHLFHFHSWRPYIAQPDYTYSVYSDNILNTFSTEVYYNYNSDDKTNALGVNLLYGGLYPYLVGGFRYTFNQPVTINSTSAFVNKLEAIAGAELPLHFSSGLTYKFLTVGTNYVYEDQLPQNGSTFKNIGFSYLHHYLQWDHYVQRAVQHIYPRIGYSLSADAREAVTRFSSYQFIGNVAVYLPGVFATHSLVLTASYQQRDTANILFSNSFVNARGYNDYYLSRMWRASANYHFPIVYPDWGIANILYIQRIRGNAFFDFERVYNNDKTASRDLRSVGGELYFDTKWWNEYPLTFGIRLSHLLDNELAGATQKNVFEILVPIVIPQ